MGRKRNQGKARKAAKAKAREEAERRGDDHQTADSSEEFPSAVEMRCQLIPIGLNKECGCTHGFNPVGQVKYMSFDFITTFHSAFIDGLRCGGRTLSECLVDARSATWEEFADVWNDSAKLEAALSHLLSGGTASILEGNYNILRETAVIARFFEEMIAVDLKETQALPNWPKIGDVYYADMHTLVKFFRHRIPCSCLDEKYKEVKHITKMGLCCNPRCPIPQGEVERSKTKYCGRCYCATYCSRECQEAHWIDHKPGCDNNAAIIAEFEDRKRCTEFRAKKRAEEDERRMEEQRKGREEAFMEWERKQKEEIRKKEEELLGLESMLQKAKLQSHVGKMYLEYFHKWAEAGGSLEDFDGFKEDFKDATVEHFGEEEQLEEIFEELFEHSDEEFKRILTSREQVGG